MKWGAEWPAQARPVVAAAARLGRRADQSRGVDVVPPAHRRRALPDRRHLVADRDGRDHDHAAARRHDDASPGSATRPFPGIARGDPRRARQARSRSAAACSRSRSRGRRCCARICGDDERYVQTYWTQVGPGDRTSPATAPSATTDGYFWLLGRVDDVMNVAGHRIGTMEVESALVDHPRVAEAAVVGKRARDQGPGDRRVRHAARRASTHARRARCDELQGARRRRRSARIARPDDILFTADLPKTRSGKIMRRLLRDIAEGRALGDTTTLADPAVVAKLKAHYEERE